MKEGMKESFVTICICIMLCVLGVGFMLFVLELDKVTVMEDSMENSVENSVETVDKRCSNCGKVVK